MGIFKALSASVKGVAADQWKEFIMSDSLTPEILMARGRKTTGANSSNTSSDDNVITDGSVIAVADGQCAVVTQSSKIVAVCSDTGEHIYSSGDSPTIFGSGIAEVAKEVGRRFTYGGDVPHSPQRVYYINTKEITGIPFSLMSPVSFRVKDDNTGMDIDCRVEAGGVYSFRIVSPETFYKNVAGNIAGTYPTVKILGQLGAELLSALQAVFGDLTKDGMRISGLPSITGEIAEKVREKVNSFITEARGIEIVSIAFDTVTLTDADGLLIKQIQSAAALRDPLMAAGALTAAQSDAMRAAASNPSGAGVGFIGANLTAGFAQNPSAACSHEGESGNFCSKCGAKLR